MTVSTDVGNTREFTRVDHAADAQWFIRFMDVANALPDYALIRSALADALEPLAGRRVLDVGCGTGDDVRELAVRVGSAGSVLGADLSAVMVAEATRRNAAAPGLPVSFRVADLRGLALGEETFDATRAKLTLAHCADVEAAANELIRVTRPGGRVATFDYDFETLVVDHPDIATTRKVVHAWVDGHHNGWTGRQTARHFRTRGLKDVTVVPQAVRMPFDFFVRAIGGNVAQHGIGPDELERWWEPLRVAEAEGRFLAAQTGFVTAGTRP
jgi:ubiquinone/menaquinone biosynthesis C-methylase UbiE